MTTLFPHGKCRSCNALITWTITTSGKRMPVDPEPHPDGNVSVSGMHTDTGVVMQARVKSRPPEATLFTTAQPRYRSHFATCPHAAQHRTTTTSETPT